MYIVYRNIAKKYCALHFPHIAHLYHSFVSKNVFSVPSNAHCESQCAADLKKPYHHLQ